MDNLENRLSKEKKILERVEQEIEQIWQTFSIDEKMTNHLLEKKFSILKRILHGLRESYSLKRT